MLSTLSAINLLQGCLRGLASPGNQTWMPENPKSNSRRIQMEPVFSQWMSSLSALRSELIPPDLLRKEPGAFQAACMNCRVVPFGKPGWFRECYATQRGHFSTLDQVAEHQKHVKTCSPDRSNEARSSTSLLQGRSCAIWVKRTTVLNRLMSHSNSKTTGHTGMRENTTLRAKFFSTTPHPRHRQISARLLYTLQLRVLYSWVPSCNHLTAARTSMGDPF